MELPVRDRRPTIRQGLPATEHRTQEVVLVVPVAIVAPEGHVEHTVEVARRQVLGRGYVVRTVVGEDAVHGLLQATSGTIGPEIALVVHQRVEGRAVLVREGDVRRTYERRDGADAPCGHWVTGILEVVEHDTAHLRAEPLDLETVGLVQVGPGQFQFTEAEGRHVVQVDPADLQLGGGRQIALIELAVAGHVAILHALCRSVVHGIVRPVARNIGIVRIRRPGTLMLRMPVRVDIATVWHGHMAQQIHGFDVGRIRVVGVLDDRADAAHRSGAAHVGA